MSKPSEHSQAGDEIKEKDEIVAVMVADSFTRAFWPITNDTPKALIPLCNIPMIEYTLELLALNKIKKIYIFCCSHAQQVLDYIESQHYSHFQVIPLYQPSCKSLGDVFRELDAKQIIRKDFLLLFADCVGNANLQDAINKHKELRHENKEFILTKVFKEERVDSPLRTEEDQTVVVLDQDQILQYDCISGCSQAKMNSNIKFKAARQFKVRYDLVDTGINICSHDVLHYFSDSFDYHDLRDHLMKDLITSEIYSDKFAAYVIPKHQYLAQVKVPQVYDAISRDIMNRWMHPVCLSTNLIPPTTPTCYKCSRNSIYKEDKVQIGHTSTIDPPTAIGSGTKIGDKTHITGSVIGRGCIIGNGVTIEHSYIWDNVLVEDGCVISHAIICTNADIGKNSRLLRGSIICKDVVLNEDTVIPETARVSLYKYDSHHKKYEKSDEGTDLGKGFIFNRELDPELHESLTAKKIEGQCIGGKFYWLESEEEQSESDESSDEGEIIIPQKGMSKEHFIEEITQMVAEAIERDDDVENVKVEINSLKFSANQSFENCITGIVKGILDTAPVKPAGHIKKWKGILEIYVRSEHEKSQTIREIESHIQNLSCKSQFNWIVKVLYEADVINEEAIINWYNETQSDDLKAQMAPFVEWLQEEEEEEEDEEEEEEEGEEEEEKEEEEDEED